MASESLRYAAIASTYGVEGMRKIKESRVLVIGTDGLGSEIIKNLSFSGFQHIDIVDCGIFDASRQFLFACQDGKNAIIKLHYHKRSTWYCLFTSKGVHVIVFSLQIYIIYIFFELLY